MKTAKINKTKSWFFKIKLINLYPDSLRKKSVETNKIRNEKGEITADTTEIQRIIIDNCK